MSDKDVFHTRQFLNQAKGMAAVEADVSVSDHTNNNGERYVSIYGNLTISDCNRNVTLDLDGSSAENVDNSLEKLDRLITTATAVRRRYAAAAEKYKRFLQ